VESNLGRSRFVTDGNNFFGLTTTREKPLPGQIGIAIGMGDPNVGMAKFPDFLACGKAFAQTRGQLILGESDPARFASILQDRSGFGSGPRDTVPDYVNELIRVIHELAIRLNC
jgi:hypothetical protein